MVKIHDRGGWPTKEPIDQSEHDILDWEIRVSAIRQILGEKGILRSDELRRGIESIEPGLYEELGYFEKWVESMETIVEEKGLVSRSEIDEKMKELET